MTVDFQPFRISAPGKRICFWGARQAATIDGESLEAQLALSGHNSGNLFIGAGLFRNLDCGLKEYHPGFGTLPPEELHHHYDYMFIAASNFVSASVDLSSAYDYLSKTKIPLFCFGLGSQFLPTQEVKLHPGTDRFLRLLSERSGSIGVRGAFTADLMWRLGIKNLSLVGCPSLLSLTSAAMDRLLSTEPALTKLAVNFSNNVRRHALAPEAFGATENALYRRVIEEYSFYILQNEAPEMTILASRGDSRERRNALAGVAQIFGAEDVGAVSAQYLQQRLRMFFNVDVWVACMKTMTASVGSRFHGNVAALLAGTPALVLAHDMRTCELCELFGLPHIIVDRAYSADEVLEKLTTANYSRFATRMTAIQSEWRLFLNRNGIDCDTSRAQEK